MKAQSGKSRGVSDVKATQIELHEREHFFSAAPAELKEQLDGFVMSLQKHAKAVERKLAGAARKLRKAKGVHQQAKVVAKQKAITAASNAVRKAEAACKKLRLLLTLL